MSEPKSATFTVADLADVRSARQAIALELGATDLGALRIEDITIAASELITNALQHAGPSADVELSIQERSILLTVTDHTPGLPTIPTADPTRIGGNGLRIVEALTDAWGATTIDGNGKQVWFRMDR